MGIKHKHGFVEICKRETGLYRPTQFARRLSADEGIVSRLDLYGKLDGYNEHANTVEFNSSGDLVVSSAGDKQVIFWNWETKTRRLSYDSGHLDRIMQTKIMPSTGDQRIATACVDGQVRLGEVLEDGRVDTKMLGSHKGCVYNLAVEPGNPHILYSCGDDAFTHQFDLRSRTCIKLLYCSKLTKRKYGNNRVDLYAIVVDPRNPNYLCIGGDEEYARVYDLRKLRQDVSSNLDKPVDTFCPNHLVGTYGTQITGLAYSTSSELLVTYHEELIYLFQKNMGLGSSPSSAQPNKPQVFQGRRNSFIIKGVNFFGPNHDYVLSGSDCGHIFIWKKNGAKLVRVMIGDAVAVNLIEPHPHIPILATCGIEKYVKLWAPMAKNAPALPYNIEEILESNSKNREDYLEYVMLHRIRHITT